MYADRSLRDWQYKEYICLRSLKYHDDIEYRINIFFELLQKCCSKMIGYEGPIVFVDVQELCATGNLIMDHLIGMH